MPSAVQAEVFRTKPGVLPPPVLVQIEVSSRCNLKCRMCPLTLETTMSSGDPGLMTEATWEQVVRMGKLAGQVTIAGFGEPLTHPDFRKMLRALDEAGIEISFSTNGIGFEKFAPELAELRNLKHVNISIDSPDPEIYLDIRGGDVERALSGARAIGAALRDRVPVTIAVVVMKQNVRSLLAFPALMQDMGIRYLVLQSLHDYTDELEREHLHTGRTLQMFRPSLRLHTVFDELLAECERHGVQLLRGDRVALDTYEPWESTAKYFTKPRGEALTKVCNVPFENMYVDSAGRVFPCCHSASGPLLGETGKQTLEEIWAGELSKEFRSAIVDPARTPEVCQKCSIVPWGEHPFRLWAGEVEEAGRRDDGWMWLRVRNTGTSAWTAEHPLRLAPSRPRDRASARALPGWHTPNRVVTMREARVEPGGVALLEFELGEPRDGKEDFFELLVEGKAWLFGSVHSYF